MTDVFTRAAIASTSTVNAEKRTVDVIWTTGAPVKRYSWEDGYYLEELEVTPQAIRLDRFEAMSLLDSHEQSMGARLGTVMPGSVKIAGGKGTATIRFSKNDKADSIFRDLVDGHPIQISVGYKIHNSQKTEGAGDQLPTLRATDWEPLELSIVAVPADPGAVSRKDESMPEPINPAEVQHPRPANIIAERTRAKTIRELARSAGIPADDMERAIDSGESVEAFRSRAFDVMIARQEQSPTFPMVATPDMGGSGQYDQQVRARTDALVARMTGATPEGDARDFMSCSLVDHARGLLEAQGVDTRQMSREDLFGFRGRSSYLYPPHTTQDFPHLLEGAGHRVLQAAYQAAQSPLKTLLSRRAVVSDFRPKTTIKVSDGGLLEKVSEGGEITAITRSESAESYRIDSYARIFSLTFQAFINDDLGALTDWSRWAGQMAAATESKELLDLLTQSSGAGPLMAEDNKRLFHADHGNLAGTPSALDETNVVIALLAIRQQKALGGRRIGIAPKYLLTGPKLEAAAQKLVATIYPADTDDAVPGSVQALIPIIEPNIDDKSWYLFADPASAPVLEFAHLAGFSDVELKTDEGFHQLATQFRAVLHFGCGAIDFRGAYRNAGT